MSESYPHSAKRSAPQAARQRRKRPSSTGASYFPFPITATTTSDFDPRVVFHRNCGSSTVSPSCRATANYLSRVILSASERSPRRSSPQSVIWMGPATDHHHAMLFCLTVPIRSLLICRGRHCRSPGHFNCQPCFRGTISPNKT